MFICWKTDHSGFPTQRLSCVIQFWWLWVTLSWSLIYLHLFCSRQSDHESQRQRNLELVKMQEEAAVRQEQIRRSTEEQIQSQRRQTELERAQIERETIRVRAIAEAEGRAYEAKISEDVNRRMLVERANMEKDKWLAAINSTFGHIGGITMDSNAAPTKHGVLVPQ